MWCEALFFKRDTRDQNGLFKMFKHAPVKAEGGNQLYIIAGIGTYPLVSFIAGWWFQTCFNHTPIWEDSLFD